MAMISFHSACERVDAVTPRKEGDQHGIHHDPARIGGDGVRMAHGGERVPYCNLPLVCAFTERIWSSGAMSGYETKLCV
jgi:hypothetical protein